MTTDTPAEIQARYEAMLMAVSPARRLEMACGMFATAKALALVGVRLECGRRSAAEEREALFLRFYGQDFSADETRKILAHLRNHKPQTDPADGATS